MEFVVGPVLALLVGMKFTVWKTKHANHKCDECVAEMVETIDKKIVANNTEMSKSMVTVITPMAKAIKNLNEQVGIR